MNDPLPAAECSLRSKSSIHSMLPLPYCHVHGPGYLATSACPQTLREAYLTGTAPKETCPNHPVSTVVDTLRKGVDRIRDFFRNLFK